MSNFFLGWLVCFVVIQLALLGVRFVIRKRQLIQAQHVNHNNLHANMQGHINVEDMINEWSNSRIKKPKGHCRTKIFKDLPAEKPKNKKNL